EIAAETGQMQNVSEKGDGGRQNAGPASGASGGEFYRDPFAPDFWSQEMTDPLAEASAEAPKAEAAQREASTDAAAQKSSDEVHAETASKQAPQETAAPAMAAEAGPDRAQQAEQASAEIRGKIEQAFGSGDKIGDGISVE